MKWAGSHASFFHPRIWPSTCWPSKHFTDTHIGKMLSQKRRPRLSFPSHNFLCTICLRVSLPTHNSLHVDHLVISEFSALEPRTPQVKSRADCWLLNTQTDTKRSSNNEEDLTKRTQYIYITEKLQLSRLSLQLLFPLYQLRSKRLNKERQKPCCFPVPYNLAFYLEIHSARSRVQFPTFNIILQPYKDITHVFGAWLK
jgi:hypothetical protein